MLHICPSILSADFSWLQQDCENALAAGADMLHFDVMDGHFVPNISFGAPVLKSLHKALPDVFFDVHFMVDHPAMFVEQFAAAGAGLITFHYEACDFPMALIDKIHALGCKVGICIKPGTPAEAVFPFIKKVDLVLVMSVEPGFGGQRFMPAALDKIRAIRAECILQERDLLIEVDGGVNAETGRDCVKAGANVLVAGSAVFGAPNIRKAVADLMKS